MYTTLKSLELLEDAQPIPVAAPKGVGKKRK
jgi:hypothetical protein